MKFSRSLAHGILGTILFLALLGILACIIDERCSRNVSDNEISWEEVNHG